MPSLYLTEPGAVLRRSGESFLVTLDEDPDGPGPLPEKRRVILEVEPHRLELIALVGRAHVTSDALHHCLDKGISLAWFSRGGDFRGRLIPKTPRSADVRLAQYANASDPVARSSRAASAVSAKLLNAAAVLADIQSNYPGCPELSAAISEIRRLASGVSACGGPPALLGLEGTAAKTYFTALASAFRADIRFGGRRRRPPPDPANSLLSFGYTLLGNLIAGMLEARGLDPALGFFHEIRPGRPSLALDILEEFRSPVVDRFVLRSCNLRVFRPDMFEGDDERTGGVRLTRDAKKTFFREWERTLASPLRERDADDRPDVFSLLKRQIERLVSDLRGGAPYAPFRYGG